MKIHSIEANGKSYEYWYDRSAGKVWYAMEVTEDGNFGESINAYTKEEIIREIKGDRVPSVNDKDFF